MLDITQDNENDKSVVSYKDKILNRFQEKATGVIKDIIESRRSRTSNLGQPPKSPTPALVRKNTEVTEGTMNDANIIKEIRHIQEDFKSRSEDKL